jgi:hypothetical protein
MRNPNTVVALVLMASLGSLVIVSPCLGGDATTQAGSEASRATHRVHGRIEAVNGSMITIQTRDGQKVQIDAAPAMQAKRSAVIVVGRAIEAEGTVDKKGLLHAGLIQRVKDSPAMWPADR